MSIQQCESTKSVIADIKKLTPEARKAKITEYKTNAGEGNPEAMFNLAVCYEEGLHETGLFTRDFKKAGETYKTPAELGHPSAQCNLGVLYYYGRVDITQNDQKLSRPEKDKKNTAEAVRLFKLAAAQGNTAAEFNLAECYRTKKATPDDEKTHAFAYYKRAALKKHKEAREQLAKLHELGPLIFIYPHSDRTTDADAAGLYIRESNIDPYAKFRAAIHYLYGMGVEQDLEKGLAWLMENADFLESLKPNIKDNYYVEAYRVGNTWYEGYQKDTFTPILPKLLKKLATTDPDTMIKELNDYALNQFNVKHSHQNGFRTFSLAAALGSGGALYNLGLSYERGEGIAQNLAMALKYYRLSAKRNNEPAQKALIRFHVNGPSGLQNKTINDAKAVEYFSAMAQEDPYAALKLGACYFNGTGGAELNVVEALKLFKANKRHLELVDFIPKGSAPYIQLQAMLASTSAAPIVNDPAIPLTIKDSKELSGDARKEAHQEAYKIVTNPAISANSYDRNNECTLLIHLISHGFTSLARIFLRKNPDLALRDRFYGRTALHWAVMRGNYLLVRNLLSLLEEQGQLNLVDAQDADGLTPLMLAASANHLSIVKLLYQAGSKPEAVDNKHETALTKAKDSKQVLLFLSGLRFKDSKESKASNPEAMETERTESEAQELIAAIKDADDFDESEDGKKDPNTEYLKEFFTQIEKSQKKRLDALSKQLDKETDAKKVEQRLAAFHIKNEQTNSAQLKQMKEILTYVDHHGQSAQDYAIDQGNTYVMQQLVILAELLNAPEIASRIPRIVPESKESKESRSQKLLTLITLPPTEAPQKSVKLFSEARKKHIQKIKALITKGIDLNVTNGASNILMYLILHDYTSLIRQVFDAPDEKGEAVRLITRKELGSKTTALHLAAYQGNPEAISILLNVLKQAGPLELAKAINDLDDQGHTPLMAALAAQNIYAAKLLIAAGTNCRAKNSKEQSAYDIARDNKLEHLATFMDSFAKSGEPDEEAEPGAPEKPLEQQQGDSKNIPVIDNKQSQKEERSQTLINAIKDGNQGKVNQLLLEEFDPNYRDCHGFNILHHAAASGDAELISELLKHPELDIDAVVEMHGQQLTALDLAAKFRHTKVTQILIHANAKLTSMKDIDQLLVVVDAKKSRTNIDDEITIARDKAFILLQNAKSVDHNPTILQLQKQGFDPKNAADPKQAALKEIKQPHLFHAAKIGDVKIVRKLLEDPGHDLNETDEYGYTPLHWATQNAHMGIINALLDKKANIDAKDSAGATPLHIAILHRKLDVVRLLVRSGANINATDKQGRNPSLYVKLLGLPEDLLVNKSTSSSSLNPVTTAPHSSWWGASSTTTTSTSTSAKADGTPPTQKKPVPAVVVVPPNQ